MNKKLTKIDIIKVTAPTRKLKATWTLENINKELPMKSNKPLTRDEEADLIIEKLKTPPKSKEEIAMERMYAAISEEIQKDIDREILEEIAKIMESKDGRR